MRIPNNYSPFYLLWKDAKDKEEDVVSGGEGIARRLSMINVDARLAALPEEIRQAKGQKLSDRQREYRYLRVLKDLGKSPHDAYTLSKLPVMPSSFRPPHFDDKGTLINPPINDFYRSLGAINSVLKVPNLPSKARDELNRDLYEATTHVMGTVTTPAFVEGEGILKTVAGTSSPKHGFFQSEVIARRQNVSGRSVITLDPELGVDEVGLPEEMGWTIYQPFTIRKMTGQGLPISQAMKEIEDRTPLARKALDTVMAERPVLLNRDPSLHKFSIMAVRPRATTGHDIKVNPFILQGMAADFDGDTAAVHVPMTEEARQESFNMLPSRHLLKPGTHEVMLKPSQAAHLGLYMLSRPTGNAKAVYASEGDALVAHKEGKIDAEQAIIIKGERTSVGRLLLRQALPDGVDFGVFDKDGMENVLASLAGQSPKEYGKTVEKLRRLGDTHITYRGFSIGLDDLTPHKTFRDRVLGEADRKAKARYGRSPTMEHRRAVAKDVYGKATEKLNNYLMRERHIDTNPIAQMVAAGSRGSKDQMRQILGAPMMAEDAHDNIIPTPIGRSYAEGVDTQGYWASGHGVRKGMVGRSDQTSLPGALAKELLASISDVVVTPDVAGQSPASVTLPLSAPDDVVDRFLARPVKVRGRTLVRKDQLISSDMIARLKKAGVREVAVYTPLNSTNESGGVPAKAFGLNEKGELPRPGDNIGVLSGHTLTEPISQMTMRSFHSGGTIGAGANIPDGFERIKQILELPNKVVGKATLSDVDGKVEGIKKNPTGGHLVRVGGQDHLVPQGRTVTVKNRQKVSRGDMLSDGVIKPQELLVHKGIEATQKYMVDSLKEKMPDTRRKYLETIVAGMTSYVEVEDSGDHPDIMPGDKVPGYMVYQHNRKSGTAKIKSTPLLQGVNMLPVSKAEQNWLAGMNYQRLSDLIAKSVTEGRRAQTISTNPIPAYVRGETFGTTRGGKY